MKSATRTKGLLLTQQLMQRIAERAQEMWGNEWVIPLARAAGISARTIRRWRDGETRAIRPWVLDRLRATVGDIEGTPEWIVGRGVDGGDARWLVRLQYPRLAARLDGAHVRDIVWIDPPPPEDRRDALLMETARRARDTV